LLPSDVCADVNTALAYGVAGDEEDEASPTPMTRARTATTASGAAR
jgi:hypothetical protein